jgi:hypothetical protein
VMNLELPRVNRECRLTGERAGGGDRGERGKVTRLTSFVREHALISYPRHALTLMYHVADGDGKQLHFWKMIDVFPSC